MSDFESRIESKIDRIMAKLEIPNDPDGPVNPVAPVTPAVANANVPGDVLDLGRWKLTLPVKGEGDNVKEISVPAR